MRLALNADLKLDEAEALAESPALLRPIEGVTADLLGGRRRARRVHPPERAARQYLDRARRA